MSPEGQQDPVAERSNAGMFVPAFTECSSESTTATLAFKFGGSSLLGADRMLHAASLVRDAASHCNVVAVVSAMKGITDRLLAVAKTLEAGCRTDARRDAQHIFNLHLEVLRDLQLEPQEHERAVCDLGLLGKVLLHDAFPETQPSPTARAALQDRLASYGERFSARLFAAALNGGWNTQ